MANVEIIAAVDGLHHYSIDYLNALLQTPVQALALNHAFTGRPGTRIHANEHDVVKIRTDLNLNNRQAVAWLGQTLAKERELGVHHPHKTWFIATTAPANGENARKIGSICPRLKPLHLELRPAPDSAEARQRHLDLFKAVLTLYLKTGKTADTKLDEGLSNFGVCPDGLVYYLDDEHYRWDHFVSLAAMLGVVIRTFDWLDQDFARDLAAILNACLNEAFQDSHCPLILARHLQNVFMPEGPKEALKHAVLQGLAQPPLKPRHAHKPPQRYLGLLADIHANSAALDCVLDYLRAQGITEALVLGDIVGYGPEPVECIERLQDSGFQVIKGNHDHAAAIGQTGPSFSSTAAAVIDWTVQQLSDRQRDWLKYLPALAQTADWTAVHGAPMDPAYFYGYVYAMTFTDNLDYMRDQNMRLCFHGHSHMAGVFGRDRRGLDWHLTEARVDLAAYQQALVCPGSVGQPRNGRPDSQFAVYDRQEQRVSFLSLPYDVQPVVEKMRRYGFPEVLWQRLLVGK